MKKKRALVLLDNIRSEEEENKIIIKGAKHHNLKNITLKLPKNKLIAFSGVSGSGKSTLVFDIIHAESQRRFMSGLSTFTKRSMDKIDKPNVDSITGITPSLAIEQKNVSNNPRSTVGTLTEISDYLRLLYSRIGIRKCTQCGEEIKSLLYKNSKCECPNCHEPIKMLNSQHFSFNTPHGMCPVCKGLGVTPKIDFNKLIINEEVSILDGAISWFGNLRDGKKSTWPIFRLDLLFEKFNLNMETPWRELPKEFRDIIIYGSGDKLFETQTPSGKISMKPIKGVATEIERLYFETDSEITRKKYSDYMKFEECNDCNGTKLNEEARSVTIGNKNIHEISNMALGEVLEFIKDIYENSEEEIFNIGKEIILEIYKRLYFLKNVGLDYLTLSRTAPTLSGGEGQRVRLATALSSEITGITYVLDEPSTGLHPRDTENLINTLFKLRDNGNNVMVVEHDDKIIESADYIVDVGPYAGVLGGNIIGEGTVEEIKNNKSSLTGKYLSGELKVSEKIGNENFTEGFLYLKGACHNNLKNVSVKFPLNKLTVVTGVSGSGKSSLISETLEPLLDNLLNGGHNEVGKYDEIIGYEALDKVINVSQSPIGRTPRSNPATYIGLFDKIRKVFGKTEYAKEHKMNADYFSFNSNKGRCPYCEGQGQIKVEMHFMPDVWIECDECNGKRFKEEVLANKIKNKNIADVLDMDVNEALEFFEEYKDIYDILKVLREVGLGYIKLGQSSTTLSGGEAQRVKLAKELSKKTRGKTIYILDEPTNGLHFNDTKQLLKIFKKLIDDGHTLIVIEHNTDVVKCANWIVDIGPEGGALGGKLVVEGTLEEVKKCNESFTGKYL